MLLNALTPEANLTRGKWKMNKFDYFAGTFNACAYHNLDTDKESKNWVL